MLGISITIGTMVATRRQIQANMTNAIHKHFDQLNDFDVVESDNVFLYFTGGFC